MRLKERIKLLLERIFGSDIDAAACKITAFSLYLCLLEDIEPSDISLLQKDEGVTLPLLIGERRNIQSGDKADFFRISGPFSEKQHCTI